MNFNQLEYVIKLAEVKNFSVAAQQLYITQPSLSQNIAGLEKELGTKLFFRTTNIVELTYAGELFLETAKQILTMQKSCLHQLKYIQGIDSGKLTLGMVYINNVLLLPNLMSVFTRMYPKVEVTVLERNQQQLEELIVQGKIDFALLEAPIVNPTIETETLHESRNCIVAVPPNHPFRERIDSFPQNFDLLPEVSLSELEDERFIMLQPGRQVREYYDEVFASYHFTPKKEFEVTNMLSALYCVAADYGITLIPELVVKNSRITPAPLCFALKGHSEKDGKLLAAYHKHRPLSPTAREFCNIVKRELINNR